MGAVAYELATGRPPFDHQSRTVTYKRIMHEEPSYPAHMHPTVADFIRIALAKVRAKCTHALGICF